MKFVFRQLSRMNYGEEAIKAMKLNQHDYVDEINFEVRGSEIEGGLSEARVVWINLAKGAKPSPRIEIFGDGIAVGYSQEFFKAIKTLSKDPDFTPEMCSKALEENGFRDVSDAPANWKKEEPFNLHSAFENYQAWENLSHATVIAEPDYVSHDRGDFKMKNTVNTIERNDENYEVNEFCPHCEHETTEHRNCEKDGYISVCSHCKKLLMLCSECMNGSNKCDWSEKGCYRCTPEMFLEFLAKRYNGTKGKNANGEHTVIIPHSSGRSISLTYTTEGLIKEDMYYDIKVLCSEAEAEEERYKDNPVVLQNNYQYIQNVFRMVQTLVND